MSLRPFMEADLWRINPQPSQAMDENWRLRILRESVPRGPCWTYCSAAAGVLGIGGMIELHAEWRTAWTILGADIGHAMVGLTRATKDVVRAAQQSVGPNGRIDMHVDPASLESVRWAAMLGFRQDAWLDRALPGGRPMGVWIYEGSAHG